MVIERLGDSIRPFTEGILQWLPAVWQQSEGHSLLRIQVISSPVPSCKPRCQSWRYLVDVLRSTVQVLLALQRLVNALGTESPSSYPVLVPILQISTDPNQVPSPTILLHQQECAEGIMVSDYYIWHSACALCQAVGTLTHILWLLGQPDELNLLEDGLQLWLIALRNTPVPQPALLSLFPNLAVAMQRSTGGTCQFTSSQTLLHV
jgi:hypothetical protein